MSKNSGHIGVNSWLSLQEFASVVRICRELGSTSTMPGRLVRQFIQSTVKLVETALRLEPINADTAQLITLLRDRYNIKSEQLNPTKHRRNILQAMEQDAADDADFKHWKHWKEKQAVRMQLEELLDEHLETD